jgi:hypothetical protein
LVYLYSRIQHISQTRLASKNLHGVILLKILILLFVAVINSSVS